MQAGAESARSSKAHTHAAAVLTSFPLLPLVHRQGPVRLVVSNLTRNVTDEHLREIFGEYGVLVSAQVQIDKEHKLPMGYAYVEFEAQAAADKAIQYMHGGQVDGNVIK